MSKNETNIGSSVEETTTERELSYTPVIKPSLETLGPVYVVFVVQNVSNTAAIDIELSFWLEPVTDFRREVRYPLLVPWQKIKFFFPEGEMKTLAEKFTTLRLDCKFKNAFGHKFVSKDTIELRTVLESWIKGGILIEETIEHRLEQLVDRIDRLERSLERIHASTGGVLIKTREDEKKEIEEMRKAYEERKTKMEAEKKTQ